MNPLRLLIIAADPLARAGLASLLTMQDNCLIVGQIAQIEEDWDELLDLYRPDVALWDLGWDVATERPWANATDNPLTDSGIPLVTLIPDDSLLNELLTAGVAGILLRNTTADRLAIALTAVTHNLRVIDPAFALGQATAVAEPLFVEEPIEPLTPREIEVLLLLAEGLTNKAIGQELDISQHTVKFHVSAIISKLGAQSRTEAVVLATRMGLLPL
ncbi:MAG: response regulator transcription factor [Anaerolineales bacterium]|nr:response regulator transcription factor [Anaerolineales bacterium]